MMSSPNTNPSSPVGTPSLLGVVLCGGQSRRMGTDKASLTDTTGATYLDVAVQRLAHVCSEVWLSHRPDQTRTHQIAPRSVLDPVEDDDLQGAIKDHGPLGAIANILAKADEEGWPAVLLCPIDLPDLQTEHLNRLLDAYGQNPVLTVADFSRVQPLLGIYPINLRDSITDSIAHGKLSVNHFCGTVDHQLVGLPAAAGRNVNRPGD